MKELDLELRLDQQFTLLQYTKQAKRLSQDQAQNLLIDVLYQLMIKDHLIRSLMKSGLG